MTGLSENRFDSVNSVRKRAYFLHETVVLRLEGLLELLEGVGREALAEHSARTEKGYGRGGGINGDTRDQSRRVRPARGVFGRAMPSRSEKREARCASERRREVGKKCESTLLCPGASLI